MVWKRGGLVAQVCSDSANRVALLHLDATQPVVLEGTAAVIWGLLDGQRDQTDVIAELEENFEDATGQMQTQVEAFLASLASQQLIESAGPSR